MDVNAISNRTVFRILAIITAFIVLSKLIILAQRPLIWVASAFFLAVALDPAVKWLARFMPRHSRGLAAGVVFILSIAVIIFMGVTLVPAVISQTQSLIHSLPNYLGEAHKTNNPIGKLISRYNLLPQIKSYQDQLSNQLGSAGGSILKVIKSAFSSLVSIITTLVLTFFMVVEGPGWAKLFWEAQSQPRRSHWHGLSDKMYDAVTGYVTGNLLTSLIAAVVVAIVMAVIGLPFAIPMGILVGIFDLIPLVGATVGAAVVILIALFHSFSSAIVMLVFFIVYQQVENHVLQPLVYARTVKMSPLMVLVSGLIGATLGGLIGALVAIPVAASIQILIRDYYSRRHPAKKVKV